MTQKLSDVVNGVWQRAVADKKQAESMLGELLGSDLARLLINLRGTEGRQLLKFAYLPGQTTYRAVVLSDTSKPFHFCPVGGERVIISEKERIPSEDFALRFVTWAAQTMAQEDVPLLAKALQEHETKAAQHFIQARERAFRQSLEQ